MTEPTPINTPSSPAAPSTQATGRRPEPVIIKKYANRRLYNTDSSSYVTLETLAEMVRDAIDFLVVDAKTGDDLTRPTLTQIIVEQEAKGASGGMNLLPIPFLRQLIGMYGDNMQWLVPNYLEQMMQHFTDNQRSWQEMAQKTLNIGSDQMKGFVPQNPMTGPMNPLANAMTTPLAGAVPAPVKQSMEAMQQVGRQVYDQNRALLEQAQSMAMKFFMPFTSPADASVKDKGETLTALKQKVASLEAELKGLGD